MTVRQHGVLCLEGAGDRLVAEPDPHWLVLPGDAAGLLLAWHRGGPRSAGNDGRRVHRRVHSRHPSDHVAGMENGAPAEPTRRLNSCCSGLEGPEEP